MPEESTNQYLIPWYNIWVLGSWFICQEKKVFTAELR